MVERLTSRHGWQQDAPTLVYRSVTAAIPHGASAACAMPGCDIGADGGGDAGVGLNVITRTGRTAGKPSFARRALIFAAALRPPNGCTVP
jgi:hypothetical protein